MWGEEKEKKTSSVIDWGLDEKDLAFDSAELKSRTNALFGRADDLFRQGEDFAEPSSTELGSSEFVVFDPNAVRRPETAPMVMTLLGVGDPYSTASGEEMEDPKEAYRYTPEYHHLYFSQTPRDPRMLPPLTKKGPLALSKEEYSYRMHRNHLRELEEASKRAQMSTTSFIASGSGPSGCPSGTSQGSSKEKSGNSGTGSLPKPPSQPAVVVLTPPSGTLGGPPSSLPYPYFRPGPVPPPGPSLPYSYPPAQGQSPYATPSAPPQGYPMPEYPPRGYPPPMGYPPQAYPPQGYPPQAYPPQGYPPPPQGYPPYPYPPYSYYPPAPFPYPPSAVQDHRPPPPSAPPQSHGHVDPGQLEGRAHQRAPPADAPRPSQPPSHPTAAAPAKATPSALDDVKTAIRAFLYHGDTNWDFARIVQPKIVELCEEDQESSRLVQRLMEYPEYVRPIFQAMVPHFDELSKHVFANYVVQKAFEIAAKTRMVVTRTKPGATPTEFHGRVTQAILKDWASDDLLRYLMKNVIGKGYAYAQHTYGSRVMQRSLDVMDDVEYDVTLNEFKGHAVACVLDANANHVIQKLIEVNPAKAQCFIPEFLQSFMKLSNDAYGCRVLQRTFEVCKGRSDVDLSPLLDAVVEHLDELSGHQYGNYVVQHGLLNAPRDYQVKIIDLLSPQLPSLSNGKFSSNVAEKVVCCADDAQREVILQLLSQPASEDSEQSYLISMMSDIYANYVIQRFLENATPEQRTRLAELVEPHLSTVCSTDFGRHLLRKMESLQLLSRETLQRWRHYREHHHHWRQ